MTRHFDQRMQDYRQRVDRCLDVALPAASEAPERLHSAMRYAVFNGGKRIRPLLAYAAAEVTGAAPALIDAPATAIELIHAFSLVHDDLPAMDDDDLRRGQPTVHRAYDEATAILAADALVPLAFGVVSDLDAAAEQRVRLTRVIAAACGSVGMTGGQSIDLASEGIELSAAELEHMYSLKTGALIHAAITAACIVTSELPDDEFRALDHFAARIGIAFQIRDDILDVEGETRIIGKPSGSDAASNKATFPSLLGVDAARRRCDELVDDALAALDCFGERAEPLRFLAHYIVARGY